MAGSSHSTPPDPPGGAITASRGAPAVPPHNNDAEIAVLGALLLSERPMYVLVIEVGLQPDHFYRARHRLIYEAMRDLYGEGDAIDVVTVAERLKQTGKLDEIGGQDAIDALAGPVPEVANLKHYAEIVVDNSKLRRLLSTTYDIQSDVHGHAGSPNELVERAERRILEVAHDDRQRDFRNIEEILETESRKWEELSRSGADLTGTPTGYRDLDRITGGLQPGNLIILAARPSMGKSTLAMNFAENASVDHGRAVAVFSLEMSEAELAQRFMASRARVPGDKLRTGKISDSDWSKISDTTNQLARAQLYLDDSSDLSVLDVRAKSRRLHQQLDGGLGMIVIDYLQLLRADGSVDSRVLQIGEMSRGLKMLARELEVPVVALSQLSRAVEQRTDKKPILSDLRESGSIEQDADVVLFIYRPEYYRGHGEDDGAGDDDDGVSYLTVAKHRNGGLGEVKLAFIPDYPKFMSVASADRYGL